MAGSLDSKPVFGERMSRYGLAGLLPAMGLRGWDTLSGFAFSTSYIPGSGLDTVFCEEVLVPLLGSKDDPRAPALRRLHWEAHTFVTADLRRQVEQPHDEVARPLAGPEREQRRAAIVARLGGLSEDFKNVLDPAHSLVDKAVSMFEENRVKYIQWADCPRRSQEIGDPRRASIPGFKTDASGYVRAQAATAEDFTADLGSTLLLKNALTRRSIAMEMASVMLFEYGELITGRLIHALTEPPADPRYMAASIDQVRAADVKIFEKLADACRGGVRMSSVTGRLPMNDAIADVLACFDVSLMLQPLPKSSRSDTPRGESSVALTGDKVPSRSALKRKRQKEKRSSDQAESNRPKTPGGGSSSDARPNAAATPRARVPVKLPAGLVGKTPALSDGRRLCFGFNLGTCKELCQPGESCSKGFHICMEPGCTKTPHHSLRDH